MTAEEQKGQAGEDKPHTDKSEQARPAGPPAPPPPPPEPRSQQAKPRPKQDPDDDTSEEEELTVKEADDVPPFLASRLSHVKPLDEEKDTSKSPTADSIAEEVQEQYQEVLLTRKPQARAQPEQVRVEPLPAETVLEEDEDDVEEEETPVRVRQEPLVQYEADPIFAYMVLLAVSVGLTAIDSPSIRYVVLWSLLGAVGAAGYLLGLGERFSDTRLDDVLAGVSFGLIGGVPLLILLGSPLATVSSRMFDVTGTPAEVMDTWAFMAVIFVMPMAESFFFRGIMQEVRSLPLTAGLATLWSMLLFFPHMELDGATGVAITLAIFLGVLNFFYSYLRFRNGLAAAWICQLVSGGLLWFAPRLLF